MTRMTSRFQVGRWCAAFLLALLSGATVLAQSAQGSLAGTVTDSAGALVPGVKVSIVNQETTASYATTTTAEGIFRFPDVSLGRYTITVNAPGFKTSVTKDVLVQITTVSAVNVTLQPGAVSEQVTVTSEGPSLETESSDIGGVVSTKQIIDLPLALGGVGALRAAEGFVFLQPATTGPGTANSSNGIFLSKVAGGQNYGNEVLIDGISQQRSENGSSFDEEAPSVEALQEFKVTTSLPEAEYGRTTGGIENFATKSGTNAYHGTGFDLYKDQALDANTFFNKGWDAYYCTGANDTPACNAQYATPTDHKNDFGGSMGGPVRIPKLYNGRDRTFFFFAWEQIRYATGGTNTVTVPTAAERGGNFADRLTTTPTGTNPCYAPSSPDYTVYGGEIFDPATTQTVQTANGSRECRAPFANNAIPSGRISAVATALLPYWPQPTNSNVFGNFTYKGSAPITDTTYTVRIDQNIGQKFKVWGSYNTRENDLFTGGLPLLPGPANPQGWWQNFTTHFVRVGLDYTISPSMLNSFVFGTNRSNSQNFSQAIVQGGNWNSMLGISNAGGSNFPVIGTGDAQIGIGSGQNDDNIDNGLHLNDSLSWTHGRHSFRFGGDVRYQQYSPINGRNENIGFASGETAGATSEGGGLGFASLLLGEANSGGTNVVVSEPRWTSWYWALFAQDDFKLSPTLTLNLGLRYDEDQPRHEVHNQTSDFSPTAIDPEFNIPGALVFGTQCNCNTAWANTYRKDFGPRVGFAWSPEILHQKVVIRGGSGILYGALVYDDFGGSMNTGYTATPSSNSPNGFDPAFQIDAGMPAFTPPPDLDPGYFNGTHVAGSLIEPTAGKPTRLYNWNLEVQQQLAEDLTMTVGYIGNHAQNLESNLLNPNNEPPSEFALGDALTSGILNNNVGVAVPFPGFLQLWGGNPWIESAVRPFPQYDYIDQGCCLENVGMSSFNALIASVQRHFHQGMNIQASYTWAKTITDADSALPNSGVGVTQDMNTNDLHADKAISAQDLRHTVVLSGLYELPFGKEKQFFNHGVLSQILGGWEVGTVERMQSGQPMSFGSSTGPPGYENSWEWNKYNNTPLKSAIYRQGAKHINPFVVIGANEYTDPNVDTMFNLEYNNATKPGSPVAGAPVAFFDPNANYARDCTTATQANCASPGLDQPYAFANGSIQRVQSEVRTPPYFNNDLSIIKRFNLGESYSLSIKAEFLNSFNQHTFSIPDTQPYDGTFGEPGGTVNGARNTQLTARFTF
jgi:hypothetical protein